jgi:predicted DNA-binding WGR domain protein
MAKRYFEYKDAKSKKFWEVSVSGKKVNIRYGKLGTDGQTSLKELGTPAEAKAHAEKQAAGKVKKGYKEAKVKAVKKAVKKVTKKKAVKKVAKKAPAKGNADQVNKKEKQELGQSLIDYILLNENSQELEGIIPSKFQSYDENEEVLCQNIEIKYPTWSIDIYRSFDEPENREEEGDWGAQNSEVVTFKGDGEDFKAWLKKNWKEIFDSYNG